MNRQFKESVWRAGFKPVEEFVEFESTLRTVLGLGSRYEPARLAIGRSLVESRAPEPLPRDCTFGKSIAGEHLFGGEIDLWISTLVMDGGLREAATIDDFRDLVEAHWARGMKLLCNELEECEKDEARFLIRLSGLLPEESTENEAMPVGAPGEVRIQVGAASRTHEKGLRVDFTLNGPGDSPHIALMGKVGSGKTTTGVEIVRQIVEKTNIPFLMIDPKGEFVNGEDIVGRVADMGIDVKAIEVGRIPIPLDFLPGRQVGSVSIQNAAMQMRDSIALCCKGAGDIQKDLLRTAVEKVIDSDGARDLDAVKTQYRMELESHDKGHDSIMSRLNELTSLNCFSPDMSASGFFGRSWVISLKALGTEEVKRLVILLLLDALKAFLLSQSDAPISNGFRSLRHLLVIDEARRILAEKKYQSLADLVRQGRSKGGVLMLLSQDPSDFEGQADDFTTQLGTCVAFACSQTQRGLKALQGVYGRKVQPNEFSDTYLSKGVAFVKLPGRYPERIVCWE